MNLEKDSVILKRQLHYFMFGLKMSSRLVSEGLRSKSHFCHMLGKWP